MQDTACSVSVVNVVSMHLVLLVRIVAIHVCISFILRCPRKAVLSFNFLLLTVITPYPDGSLVRDRHLDRYPE